jgi:glycosyltransferase involved in cell wall biosynthesis
MGAIVEIAGGELVTPAAEAQVLYGPGQRRLRGGERQHLPDHLECLTCVAIDVHAIGLGGEEHLAAGRRRPHAVALAAAHRRGLYQRSRPAQGSLGPAIRLWRLRVLIFHGYLLRGTGSNVYNAKLGAALVAEGHEVHMLCQDPSPADIEMVDAVGTWEEGVLRVETSVENPRWTAYRPPIGTLLPVYVADVYAGFEARPFAECSDAEVASYVERNVAAVRDVAARAKPDVALANHLVMGPVVLARALEDTDVPYAVKVHGSALEYTVKPHPERFLEPAREGIARAKAVLVGSRHTAESLWQALADPELPARTRLGPPGVDIEQFAPAPAPEAGRRLRELAARLSAVPAPAAPGEGAFARDDAGAGLALARVDPAHDRLVTFVGKLIVSKGVDLALAAWPLVLRRVPSARLLVVGFGAYREGLERLAAALADGNLAEVRLVAEAGRELEGGPRAPLRHLLAFLDSLGDDERQDYWTAAAAMRDAVVFVGRLDHAELADLLPACEAQLVPSTFPEAFGMVAAEAAACGVLPISAAHSGLAEVSRALAQTVPAEAAAWLGFDVGPRSVADLAERVVGWLEADAGLREATRDALVQTARARFSWTGVAHGVVAAAQGHLDELPAPA